MFYKFTWWQSLIFLLHCCFRPSSFSACSIRTFFHVTFNILLWDFSMTVFAVDTIHFRMCHHMIFACGLKSEFFTTQVTDKWVFICMYSHVCSYISRIGRGKITNIFIWTFEFSISILFIKVASNLAEREVRDILHFVDVKFIWTDF